MTRRILVLTGMLALASCAAVLSAGGLTGGRYTIDPLDVNSGGTRSLSLPYDLTASTGQAGGIGPLTGGVYDFYDGFWPAASGQAIEVFAELDSEWVYQNTPVWTAWRHASTLTLTVSDDPYGNTQYTSTLSADPPDAVLLEPTADPMRWIVRGARHDVGPVGDVTLVATVTGVDQGGEGDAGTGMIVRPLGDINGDGAVTAADKLEINRKLNGQTNSPGVEFDGLDLTGDGLRINAEDKLILNAILNGLVAP